MSDYDTVKAMLDELADPLHQDEDAPIGCPDCNHDIQDHDEGCKHYKARAAAIAAGRALLERLRWVPVTERLPTLGGNVCDIEQRSHDVLVLTTTGACTAACYQRIVDCAPRWSLSDAVTSYDGTEEIDGDVTHWRELPGGPEVTP